jgi:hypothetical protein
MGLQYRCTLHPAGRADGYSSVLLGKTMHIEIVQLAQMACEKDENTFIFRVYRITEMCIAYIQQRTGRN